MTLYTEAAERMADAALAGLLDRGGISDELSEVKYSDEDTWNEIRSAIGSASLTALIAFLSERGLRVVPVEATEGMAMTVQPPTTYTNAYRAMIAAAPNVWGVGWRKNTDRRAKP
jgi:hypothetical protein